MDLTLSCFNCSQVIPNKENYFFCLRCLTQIRCKNCNEPLIKDAIGCINCGISIKEAKFHNTAINTIEFEQKGNNKKFVASFTDQVGENLVTSLGGLFLGTSYKPMQTNPFAQTKPSQLLSSTIASKNDSAVEDAIVINPPDDELNSLLIKIFRSDDDKIVLVNSRVKHTGKKDKAIRITLLLLHAYSLTGKQQVKRSVIVDMLQSSAVYDNNFISWLSKCDEVKKVDGDILELNLPGRDAAIEILKEFSNPSIDKGSVHFSSGNGKSSKSKNKKSKTDSAGSVEIATTAKLGSSSSKMTPVKMIDILISEKYFSEKRRVPEIIKYCKDIKAHTLDTSTLSTALSR
jgi:hypothetical protein